MMLLGEVNNKYDTSKIVYCDICDTSNFVTSSVCILFVHPFCILLENLFTKFSPVHDTLGQYLLNREKVQQIWEMQN